MKKNVKIGLMAGLLLAPGAIVAQTTEVNASSTADVFAATSEQDRLIAIFSRLHENSTGTDIQSLKNMFEKLSSAEREILKDELDVIEAKVVYLDTMYKLITEARDINTKMSTLNAASPTIIQDVADIEDRYERLNYAVNLAQTDFKNIFFASTSVRKGDIADSLLYYDNDEAQNEALMKSYLSNITTFQSALKLVAKPGQFIETYLDNLQNLSEATFRTDIPAARAAYNQLTAEEKKVIDAYVINGTTAIVLLTDAEALVANVQKVNTTYNELQQLVNPTAATFVAKVTALKTAVDAIEERYYSFFEPVIEDIAFYTEVIDIISGIQTIGDTAAADVEAKITDLEKRYNSLTTIYKGYVSNHGNLIQARNDLKQAQTADNLVLAITSTNLDATLLKAMEYYKTLTSAQKKMLQHESALLTWDKGSNSAGLVVNNIAKIKLEPNAAFVKGVRDARIAFDKLGNPVIDGEPFEPTSMQRLVGNYPWLVQLAKYELFVAQFITLKSTNYNYKTEVARLTEELQLIQYDPATISVDQQNALNVFVKKMSDALEEAQKNITAAETISSIITSLQSGDLPPDELLLKMDQARTLYNDKKYLSAEAKKMVTNIDVLVQLEKEHRTIVKVTNEIGKLKTSYSSKGIAKKISTANKNYMALTENQQKYVYNAPLLKVLLPVESFMKEVDSLKAGNSNYHEQVARLMEQFPNLLSTLTMENNVALRTLLTAQYYKKLDNAVTNIEAARKVTDLITRLMTAQGQAAAKYVEEVTDAYKRLTSEQKRLVTNYDQFQSINNTYKNSAKVIKSIQTWPSLSAENAKSFGTKYKATQKAFEALTDKEKTYVYNQELIHRYTKAAPLILDIANLKVTAKNYKEQVAELQKRYEVLSAIEKTYIVNYSVLERAHLVQHSADNVIELIKSAVPTSAEYIAKLREAREAYDNLSRDEQKLVTNYKDLTTREKSVKPILALDEQIELLPTYAQAKTFISNYNSAYKSYEKLSLAERAILTNREILTVQLPPIFEVVNQIASIKPASESYVADVKAAREAYNKLTVQQQAAVMNVKDLEKHELNVDGGKHVDELIRALKSSAPSEYIAKVKEAREAYDQLTKENKRAVTLYEALLEEEKYIKPVEQAIEYVAALSKTTNNFSTAYKKAKRVIDTLNDEQLSLVPNIHLFSNLDNVMRVIELIEKIKPSDKYYIGNTQAAKLAYDKLSVQDKMKVANVTKLEEAVANTAALDVVVKNIASLSSTSSTYFDDVGRVLEIYKDLPSALRKQVVNYNDLEKAEKDIAVAQKMMKQIDEIDPELRTFESKTRAARTAFNRLTEDQQKLVANINKLIGYENELGL